MDIIDYTHSNNQHSLDGPQAALPSLFRQLSPQSVLDVGCGTGTWLRAITELGVKDIYGLDGVDIPADDLLFPVENFKCCDLTIPIKLNRKFDVTICFEVAEHLDEKHAKHLITTLTEHADHIFFSAACPGQPGQHHVNCQWPDYWQSIFNSLGFRCDDSIRWQLWSNPHIEWWYRQNMFTASRDPEFAGTEGRIPRVVHPALGALWLETNHSEFESGRKVGFSEGVNAVKHGYLPKSEYCLMPLTALFGKLKRWI